MSMLTQDFIVVPGMEYEVTRLRKINPQNPEDFSRVYKIDQDPNVKSAMADVDNTTEDIIEFIEGSEEDVLFGIAGWSKVTEEEKGQLQGWVYVYSEDEVNERVERVLGKEMSHYTNIIEISYAKFPGAASGQISSALRQVCKLIEFEEKNGHIHEYPHPLFIPQSYHNSNSNLEKRTLVVGFASDDNPGSVRVLEKAGFICHHDEVAWDADEPDEFVSFYILDWERLDQIIQHKQQQSSENISI